MIESVTPPPPDTTLVIILGASDWPLLSDMEEELAFAKAAAKIQEYFLNSFRLPPDNLLSLFDTEDNIRQIDKRICGHLDKFKGKATDIILYYVGHGKLAENDSKLYFPIRDSEDHNPEGSSLKIEDLARTLKSKAPQLRRFYILDCCFAGLALHNIQATDPTNGILKSTLSRSESPGQGGYAAFCSSSHNELAIILPTHENTYFTEAFLRIVEGVHQDNALSFESIQGMMPTYLDNLFHEFAQKDPHPKRPPKPEIYGKLKNTLLFPTGSYNNCLIQEIIKGLPPRSSYLIRQIRCELDTQTVWLQFAYSDGNQALPQDLLKTIEEAYGWHVMVEDTHSIQKLKLPDSTETRENLSNGHKSEMPFSNSMGSSSEEKELEQRHLAIIKQLLPPGVTLTNPHLQKSQLTWHITCEPGITQDDRMRMKAEFKQRTNGYTLGPTSTLYQLDQPTSSVNNRTELISHLLNVARQLLPRGVNLIRYHYQQEQTLLQITCEPGITQDDKMRIQAEFKRKTEGYTLGPAPIIRQPRFQIGEKNHKEMDLLNIAQRLFSTDAQVIPRRLQEEQRTLHIDTIPHIPKQRLNEIKADFQRTTGYTLGSPFAPEENRIIVGKSRGRWGR